MKVMKLPMYRMLAFLHQMYLLQQIIFYSTSVPGETTGKPIGQFSLFCVQNYLWFCSLLDAGLILGQWEPRLLKNEVAIFRSGGILNHLVKGDAFDTIYLTTSSPKPLQKTNKHKMREVFSWMIRKKQWWDKLELPVESCRDLCCICRVQCFIYDKDKGKNSCLFMIISFSEQYRGPV